ncbi:HAD family hydrolase [Klenkia taihuensis]|uniref:Hydroxymethylpyrimidine pyrophosphatase n=1 Tax=Klenkia taihuensis TaxID=1225127 RepID=A0A1I1N0B7_9ACTN|nr:HAD hydrolase family protein [Klenkia taihuensis]GHE12319.1 hypothetical protein GCM10011381_29690 [Klenkia taihuensis]SFC91144.1 hypothetical protein SAMN05661030_1920 [Klenkia taihuensis]
MPASIVYTDLDGTMVGPRGSFVHTADGQLTAEPWTALLELHRAGVPLVLVSGRTHAQLQEAGRVFAADGWVAELGSTVSWSGGREVHLLTGELPGEFAGRAPVEVMAELGVVDALVAAWPGRVEWHAPWSASHTGDAMLRGRLDTAEVDAWLAERGWGWLTLKDNGRVPRTSRVTLAVEGDPHVYHLMPRGIGKGLAITWDLERRGLDPADAVAVGDSVSDLEMASAVGRLFLTANGAAVPGMAAAVDALPNATATAGAMGLGWAEAVHAALRT